MRVVRYIPTTVVAELAKLRHEVTWSDDVIQVLDVDPTNLTKL
jgi:hypothetical protein